MLTSDVKRDAHEPTGEPESLAGRLKHKMGDRVQHSRPEGLAERKERGKKREAKAAELELALPAKSRKTAAGMSVMDLDTAGFYRPRTKETRAAYEAMLNAIHAQFGDQPQDVLRGAADEVLAVLKNQALTDPQRQREVGELLGAVADERFAELVAIGKLINDWVAPGEAGAGGGGADGDGDTLDQEIGVAVEFESEDEDGDDERDEVVDDDEDEDDADEEAAAAAAAAAAGRGEIGTTGDDDGGDGGGGGDDDGGLRVQEIDAYWLQRRVAAAFPSLDAAAAQRMAADVFGALQGDAATVETRVVQLLGLDQFPLAKELLRNRAKVVWVTRLRQAQDDAERAAVEAEMAADAEGAAILDALRATRTTARERQSAMERQVRVCVLLFLNAC